jgi:hypothetical protein
MLTFQKLHPLLLSIANSTSVGHDPEIVISTQLDDPELALAKTVAAADQVPSDRSFNVISPEVSACV